MKKDESIDIQLIVRVLNISEWIVGIVGLVTLVYLGQSEGFAPLPLVFVGVGFSMLTAGLFVVRTRFVKFVDYPVEPSEISRSFYGVTTQSFWMLLFPAIFATAVMALVAEGLVGREIEAQRQATYRDLIQSVLLPKTQPLKARFETLMANMVNFEHVMPFAYVEQGDVKYNIDDETIRKIEAQMGPVAKSANQRSSGAHRHFEDPDGRFKIVWATLEESRPNSPTAKGRSAIVGIRYSTEPSSGTVPISVALLFVAFCGASLLALWRSAGLKRWMARLHAKMEMIGRLTDEQKIPLIDAPHEVAEIDRALLNLENRVLSMHDTGRSAIESGHQNREMKSHLFAGMSHDLRSPLNSVIGFSELLLKEMDGPLSENQRKAVVSIAQESERLVVLVADILDTSKLKAGRLELSRSWVPSIEILTECEAAACKLIGIRPIQLLSEFQPGLPPVFIDKSRVIQALLDLVTRAIDSMQEGTIKLKASKTSSGEGDEGRLKVDVIDTSRAISKDDRERLSEVFAANSDLPVQMGQGGLSLGLALARDIIRLHGGELTVITDGQFGTIFTFTLPLSGP